jgi:6-methylsalicylate decarboxylase
MRQHASIVRHSRENHASVTLARRELLQGLLSGAALAATAAAIGSACAEATSEQSVDADAGAAGARTGRIDTHHHALPPEVKQWMVDEGLLPAEGGPPWATWSLDGTLQMMDAHGIQAGVISQPAPSDLFIDRRRAEAGVRLVNESMATLVQRHPSRFGFFAYLPLAHVDLALEELAYAADVLGADGFLLMNHVEDRYLGDPTLDPLFEELQRRRAVVLTHPDELPNQAGVPGIATHLADFMLDTTRAAIRMMFSGVLERYPDISIILPHGGGFLPYVGARLSTSRFRGDGIERDQVREHLRRFYYDTASPMSPYSTPTLLTAADPSHLLYGTDWHQVASEIVAENAVALDNDPALDESTRRAIGRDNALALFPRLAQRIAG